MYKVLNIARFLPINGFPKENDITFKIYAELRDKFDVKSQFIMPLTYIPKWLTLFKTSLRLRYRIINSNYIDNNSSLKVFFFKSIFPTFIKLPRILFCYNISLQFPFFKGKLYDFYENYLPDIIHAHTIHDAFYAYKLHNKYGVSYVITLRGMYSEIYKLDFVINILKNASGITTPSYQLFDKLNCTYDIKLIPHGIENEWYSNTVREFVASEIRMVTTSRLLEMKNIQIVIQGIKSMVDQGQSISYLIIGEGPFKKQLEELVNKLNLNEFVKFCGFLPKDDIIEIYKNRDIFIMLSYPETFGRAYFEAAANGLLIIGAKNTGAHGHFDDDDAYFIEPTVKSVVETLKLINHEVYSKKVSRLRRKVNFFRNDQVINGYYQLLKQ